MSNSSIDPSTLSLLNSLNLSKSHTASPEEPQTYHVRAGTVEIHCGIPLLAQLFHEQLVQLGLRMLSADPAFGSLPTSLQPAGVSQQQTYNRSETVSTHSDIVAHLILDIPRGFAFKTLQELKRAFAEFSDEAPLAQLTVVTFSTRPEYWDNLWDLQPDILLVNPRRSADIGDALVRSLDGESYRITPTRSTVLTPAERAMLHYLALGGSNKGIAEQLCVQEQTVMNTLSGMYKKLNLRSRADAMLYYWGHTAPGDL
jgi:DNA-binding NarL/FixJ family response regulator